MIYSTRDAQYHTIYGPGLIYTWCILAQPEHVLFAKMLKMAETMPRSKKILRLKCAMGMLLTLNLSRDLVRLASGTVSPLVGVRSPAMAVVFLFSRTADGGFLRALRFPPPIEDDSQ